MGIINSKTAQRIPWRLSIFAVLICCVTILYALLLSQDWSVAILLLVAAIAVIATWYVFFRQPWIGLLVLIFSIVPGQLLRISIGPRGGTAILLIDIVTAIFIAAWIFRKLLHEQKITPSAFGVPLLAFLAIGLLSLVQGAAVLYDAIGFDLKQYIIGGLYLGRLIMYSLTFFAARDLMMGEKDVKRAWHWLSAATILVAVAGFIQFVVYPDFTSMAIKYGWDPHIGRLLSTWFDPNFVGGFFAVIALIALSVFLYQKQFTTKAILGVMFLVLVYALILTYSRSGYLALAIGLLAIGVWKFRRILLAMLVLGLLLGAIFPRSLDRITDGFNFDATAQKRIVSWQHGISVLARYPLLGTGYNLIAPIQDEMGLVGEFDINNRAGFENSLLTVLVAMGIPGLLVFVWLWLKILGQAFILASNCYLSNWGRGFSLGVFAGLLGLVVHSLFINSLLFVLIYLPLMVLLAGIDCLRAVGTKGTAKGGVMSEQAYDL